MDELPIIVLVKKLLTLDEEQASWAYRQFNDYLKECPGDLDNEIIASAIEIARTASWL
jgi:hypothetical protein